jgi:hypothetical protein
MLQGRYPTPFSLLLTVPSGLMTLNEVVEVCSPYPVSAPDSYGIEQSILDPRSYRFGVDIQFFSCFFNTHPLRLVHMNNNSLC